MAGAAAPLGAALPVRCLVLATPLCSHTVMKKISPNLIELSAKSLQKTSRIDAHQSIAMVLPWVDQQQAAQAAEILASRAGMAFDLILIQDNRDCGPSAIINEAFEKTDARLFGYLAQDVFPSRNWLIQAAAAIKKTGAGLLAFNDGKWAGQIAAFGLADRKWIDSVYGGQGLFYSGYLQHYGDVELSLIARQQKRLVYDSNAVMMEVDFSKEARSVNAKDRECFAARKLTGFDGRVSDSQLLGLFG
jgi:hypothetical protein